MGVDLYHQDERGVELGRVLDPKNVLARLLDTHAETLAATACLRFIDRYCDTTFNHRQIPVLVTELERLAGRVAESETHAHLCEILILAPKAEGRTHTYLKFVGD